MIGIKDTHTLASTKLKTRKIRTIITIFIAGLMFSLLMTLVLITNGLTSSFAKLSGEGAGKRYITMASPAGGSYDDGSSLLNDPEVIKEIEAAHADLISRKVQKAKELKITYNPKEQDPSPVITDAKTGSKSISEEARWNSPIVEKIISKRTAVSNQFDITKFTKGFDAKPAPYSVVVNSDLSLMPGGKETAIVNPDQKQPRDMDMMSAEQSFSSPIASLVDSSLIESYVSLPADKLNPDLIPIVIPYNHAERLLGLSKIPQSAPSTERIERIKTVRQDIQGLTINTCFRNPASSTLLSTAIAQAQEIEKNKNKSGYEKPSVIYNIPAVDSCGAVTIASDSRSAYDKDLDRRMTEFTEAFDESARPVQEKINFQVIGVSPSSPAMPDKTSLVSLVEIMYSQYGPEYWQIPADAFVKLAEAVRPSGVFGSAASAAAKTSDLPGVIGASSESQNSSPWDQNSPRLEFPSYDEFRRFEKQYACTWTCDENNLFMMPETSAFITENVRRSSQNAIFWMLIVIGTVAAFILSAMIGRVIADGRRETAVFRAIGAKRVDIGAIYLAYTLQLSLIIILFVLALSSVIALIINYFYSAEVTVSALIAFGTQDLSKTVSFIDFSSRYSLIIPGAILLITLLSALFPLLLNVRRNPIHDMRQE